MYLQKCLHKVYSNLSTNINILIFYNSIYRHPQKCLYKGVCPNLGNNLNLVLTVLYMNSIHTECIYG